MCSARIEEYPRGTVSLSMSKYRPDLQTSVDQLTYDFERGIGVLYMPEGANTDRSGCIELFKKIDPNVRRIWTVAGPYADTAYFKTSDGQWNARTLHYENLLWPIKPPASFETVSMVRAAVDSPE
jgi:hypothetical protein